MHFAMLNYNISKKKKFQVVNENDLGYALTLKASLDCAYTNHLKLVKRKVGKEDCDTGTVFWSSKEGSFLQKDNILYFDMNINLIYRRLF